MSDTLTKEDVKTRPEVRKDEPGDHDTFSHYVRKSEIARAAVTGQKARALCGKVWVPTKDGERFPVCPNCKALYLLMKP